MFSSKTITEDCGIISRVDKQGKFRIAVDTGSNPKSTRDRCSGFMRYVMERSLPWDIRFFAHWEMQDRQTWNRIILKWKPHVIYLNSSLYDIGDGRLKRIPHIVLFRGSNVEANMKFPRRTRFVHIDNRQNEASPTLLTSIRMYATKMSLTRMFGQKRLGLKPRNPNSTVPNAS